MKHNIKFKEAVKKLQHLKNIDNSRDILWQVFSKNKCGKKCGKGIRVLILNAPCNGFGDIVFAKKIGDYLKQWYGATVTIATTKPKGFISLGVKKSMVVKIRTGTYTPHYLIHSDPNEDCRRFRALKLPKLPTFDLIFVAPIVSNFEVELRDVKYIIPYATKTNTFFFSEYNDKGKYATDFPTGIGNGRLGLLFTDQPSRVRYRKLKNPYIMTYIASEEVVPTASKCMMSFIRMVVKKYSKKHNKLDIVIPGWIGDEDYWYYFEKHLRQILKYYPRIFYKEKGKRKRLVYKDAGKGRELTLRADIYPVPNKTMTTLFRHSLEDVLVTGDQSITDVLACCASKNIFYQIVEWKKSFAANLAALMPNKYLLKKSTACGTLNAIKYKSNYTGFTDKWDFRKNARPKLNGIILAAKAQKENKDFRLLAEDINKARGYGTLKAIDRLKQLY
jgi:hypothetical protein